MLDQQNYALDEGARAAFAEYIPARRTPKHFANARSIRNALDRIRLRLAHRVVSEQSLVTREDLMTIRALDVRARGVFGPAAAIDGSSLSGAGSPA